MKNQAFRKTAAMLLAIVVTTSLCAQNKSQDHNSTRSNKTASIFMPNDGWNFGAGTGASFALKSSENSMFRGNSIASKTFGHYNFGAVGLGFSTGIIPGAISSSAVNMFLTERKFPTDAVVSSTKPLNAYLLFGPSFNFGRRVNISTGISGGMFYNNSGSLTIGQQGATRSLYRFDAGSKNVFPGLSGTLNIAYPLNNSTKFFINTDYLQTSSSIRVLDPQRGIDVAAEQNRAVKLFTAGVGIVKSFSTSRDAASGLATGKKHIGNVKYENISLARDAASGQATGKRIVSPRDPQSGLPTGQRIVSPRDPQSGLPTGKRISSPRDPQSGLATGKRSATEINNESCGPVGPVTVKKTNPDGSVEEQNFSCPADAANYAKQTQGATFGEKVNQGLHAAGGALAQGALLKNGNIIHRDIAARNIIAGTVSWSSGASGGIVTNQSAAVSSVGNLAGGAGGGAAAASYAKINSGGSGAAQASYASTGMVVYSAPTGVSTTIHTRDAASGLPTGKRSSRDAASGLPTGRRQYQPVYFEGGHNNCNDCGVSVKDNPLYKGNNNSGTNPLHKSSSSSAGCNGVEGLKVYLMDVSTGSTVATTTTEACGEFYFANVPSGNYALIVSGSIAAKKGYDAYLTKGKYDVAGEIVTAGDFWAIEIITAEGTPDDAAELIKTKTKSNQSNDRTGNTNSGDNTKAIINTSRSNIKHLAFSLADADEDGVSELWVGNIATETPGASLLSGALPGGKAFI